MADEHNTATVVIDDKVEFTPTQQEKVNELIAKSMGKAAATLRAENEGFKTQLATLEKELREAKTKPTPTADGANDATALQAQIDAMKEASKINEGEVKRLRSEAEKGLKEVENAKKETLSVRKDNAITTAASSVNFINNTVVRKLTEDQITWSPEYSAFVVLNDAGQVRLDATLENPLSLEQFFTEFATKNKYLVRGEVVSGTSSTEAARLGFKSGKVDVNEIFGPKSNAKLAQELIKTNPQEYKRLKVIAKSNGIIA